jgi:hypothetical protein
MKAFSSSFAEGRPTADDGLWHHTLVCAQSCAMGLLFSGRVRQSSRLQGAEQAQVSDLLIS